jgi:hypothetical protein
MFYPAYNQTVNRFSMARLGSGVEVGMERFDAAHTAADRDPATVSIMRASRIRRMNFAIRETQWSRSVQDRPLANQLRGIVRSVPSAASLR